MIIEKTRGEWQVRHAWSLSHSAWRRGLTCQECMPWTHDVQPAICFQPKTSMIWYESHLWFRNSNTMVGRIRDHVEIIPQASKPETWISLSSRDRVDPKFESWLGHRQLYNFKLNEMKAITETFCPGVKYVKYSGKINTIYLEIIHCWISHYISRNITESKWQKIIFFAKYLCRYLTNYFT